MLFSFDRLTISNLVIMAKWTHLFSSRTQKLSTSAATISRRALVKIAHRQVIKNSAMSSFLKKSSDNGKVDTPVLIPNTEVKHFSGDNI